MTVAIKQDVLWLHIAIDDVATMEILQGQQQLRSIELRDVLVESTTSSQKIKEFALNDNEEYPWKKVHQQVQLATILECKMQSYYKLVLHRLQYVAFCQGMNLLLLGLYATLLENLHGVEFGCIRLRLQSVLS